MKSVFSYIKTGCTLAISYGPIKVVLCGRIGLKQTTISLLEAEVPESRLKVTKCYGALDVWTKITNTYT